MGVNGGQVLNGTLENIQKVLTGGGLFGRVCWVFYRVRRGIPVGASLLAKNVNDNAVNQVNRVI
jgi:hypothetical protein